MINYHHIQLQCWFLLGFIRISTVLLCWGGLCSALLWSIYGCFWILWGLWSFWIFSRFLWRITSRLGGVRVILGRRQWVRGGLSWITGWWREIGSGWQFVARLIILSTMILSLSGWYSDYLYLIHYCLLSIAIYYTSDYPYPSIHLPPNTHYLSASHCHTQTQTQTPPSNPPHFSTSPSPYYTSS